MNDPCSLSSNNCASVVCFGSYKWYVNHHKSSLVCSHSVEPSLRIRFRALLYFDLISCLWAFQFSFGSSTKATCLSVLDFCNLALPSRSSNGGGHVDYVKWMRKVFVCRELGTFFPGQIFDYSYVLMQFFFFDILQVRVTIGYLLVVRVKGFLKTVIGW